MTLRTLSIAPCLLATVLLSSVGGALAPAVAFAQDDNNPAIEKVTALNKKAVDAYNDLEFEEARKLLKQALDLCTASGLDSHPIAARTHIHMGVVLIAAKQQDLGIKQFKRAIEIQPDIQVTKQMANPEILEAFKEAGAGGGGGGGAEPAGAGAAPAPDGASSGVGDVKGIQHRPVARARRGKAIPVVVTIGEDVTGYTKVLLEYKPEGATEFEEVPMRKSGGRYMAEIPASAARGSAIAYYIEADSDDESADSIATSGSEDHPYNIFLTGGADSTGKTPECEGDNCEEEEIGPRFFVSLTGGIGFGVIAGFGEINSNKKVSPGFAPASVAQITPEIGYFVAPGFRLSLQLRYQIVGGTTPLNLKTYLSEQQQNDPAQFNQCGDDHLCSTRTTAAVAVLARGSWFFGSGMFRPYFSLAAGGGYMRHNVTFSELKKCGTSGTATCVDTVLAGPVFVGPGAGALLALTENFGVLAELSTVVGLPKFTYNIDLNIGAAARF